MIKQIQIPEEIEVRMRKHAELIYPYECCGFLFGIDGNVRIFTETIEVENKKEGDQRRRFEINPLDYLKAEQYADRTGLQLIGIYHSHPDHPAIASSYDLEKAMPYFSYVIVSVQKGQSKEIQSWRLKESRREFEEENIIWLDSPVQL